VVDLFNSYPQETPAKVIFPRFILDLMLVLSLLGYFNKLKTKDVLVNVYWNGNCPLRVTASRSSAFQENLKAAGMTGKSAMEPRGSVRVGGIK
jgi:hypothetical protein